ncbi:hypothetical protein AADR41_17050 [Streptomyces sp. CLV115]|uniref:hypothetical protein n=1 Tax=Streptomyces sp. CLV115 TaxID=3138502 RepID=UPI00313C57FC
MRQGTATQPAKRQARVGQVAHRVHGNMREVHGVRRQLLALTACRRQSRDQLFRAGVGAQSAPDVRSQAGGDAALGQGDLQGGALKDERGAEFVRDVGGEAALGGEAAVQAVEHDVEGVAARDQTVDVQPARSH